MKPLAIIIPVPAILAGLVSGLLYILVYRGIFYGVTAPLLPLMGLAYAGLAYGRAGLTTALLFIIPLVSTLLPLPLGLLLIFLQIIPLNLCIRLLMTARLSMSPPFFSWVSPVSAVSYMCMYLALFTMMIVTSDGAFYHSIINTIEQMIVIDIDMSLPQELDKRVMLFNALLLMSVCLVIFAIFVMHALMRTVSNVRRAHIEFASWEHPPRIALILTLLFIAALVITQRSPFTAGIFSGCMMVLCAYVYAGLAAIHALVHQLTAAKKKYILYISLIVFYVYMFSFMSIVLPGVALFGITRHLVALWYMMRARRDI
jgi:hypothetical protein